MPEDREQTPAPEYVRDELARLQMNLDREFEWVRNHRPASQ